MLAEASLVAESSAVPKPKTRNCTSGFWNVASRSRANGSPSFHEIDPCGVE
jgi:hypothetical protein